MTSLPALLLASLAFAAAPPAPPASSRTDLPFRPGESLVYDVAWTMLNAGTVTLSVGHEPGTQPAAWHYSAEGRPGAALASLYPLYYKADAIVDPATLLPQKAWVYQQEGSRKRTRLTLFDQAAKKAHFEQVGTGRLKDYATPAGVQDSLSVLYAVRAARNLAPGARLSVPVSDSGRIYTAELSVGAAETIDTPIGKISAYRITPRITNAQGQAERRPITIWVSTDARRLPVKIEIELAVGSFKVTLREAKSG
jgi:hypothetical protein